MIGRLVHKADFERVLATPPRSRSAHFAVHHVSGGPSTPSRGLAAPAPENLSTENAEIRGESVDNSLPSHWLGSIVPKRHARRAVTRNLLRRQIRQALSSHLGQLPPGLWLVRLRSPFPREQFPSASSQALRAAAAEELERLFRRAAA